jgi:hypothetical protein
MKQGRPANTQPATAYDFRRALTLVQVLALDKSDGLKLTDCRTLARHWQLSSDGDLSTLLQRLAQHALEYSRDEVSTDEVSK